MLGLIRRAWRLGTKRRCRICNRTFVNPAIPAALSQCPMFDFTDPIGQARARVRFEKRFGQSGDFHGIPKGSAGSMRFHIADSGGINFGPSQRSQRQFGLGCRIGYGVSMSLAACINAGNRRSHRKYDRHRLGHRTNFSKERRLRPRWRRIRPRLRQSCDSARRSKPYQGFFERKTCRDAETD